MFLICSIYKGVKSHVDVAASELNILDKDQVSEVYRAIAEGCVLFKDRFNDK